MRSLKKIVAVSLTSIVLLSTTITGKANAETSQQTITNSQSELQQTAETIHEKQAEQQAVSKELQGVQNELASVESELTKNQQQLESTEQTINDIKAKIEEKKEEIVVLEDKVLARKDIMKERLVSLQQSDQTNAIINVLLNSESFSDFLDRAAAVATFLNVDKDLLDQQQQDLKKIEEEKAAIDEQEQLLQKQYAALEASQVEIQQTIQKRQAALTSVQEKYNQVSAELKLAQNEKAQLEQQIANAQAALQREQQVVVSTTPTVATPSASVSGKELYVTATAYSHEETTLDITALGYNIRNNPNMKLIAVDPSVIPLGSKVWVEGYGEAIAGDTGGAIKGHKIDVLMPSGAAARSWGRKTVKIIILD